MKSVLLMFMSLLTLSGASFANETTPYDVVAEFIRELGDTKNSQDTAKAETAETQKLKPAEKNQQTMLDAIRNSTRISLKLQTSNSMLKSMNLKRPFETLIPTLITWNEQKLKLYAELSNTAKTFLDGPKPNVDYTKLMARMPEITAEMEYADESIFKLTPLVFALLIDNKPDGKNHVSHLVITREEGKRLIDSINSAFGSSLNQKNQNWTVGSATVLRTYLTEKGFKFSDDRWE